ncbi:MAG TPA: hypothetical protein VIT23_01430, partial [Terrimicrobiaceae bacterium]
GPASGDAASVALSAGNAILIILFAKALCVPALVQSKSCSVVARSGELSTLDEPAKGSRKTISPPPRSS